MERQVAGALGCHSATSRTVANANGLGLVRVQFLDGYSYMALAKTRINQASRGNYASVRLGAPSIHCDVPWRAGGNAISACCATHFCVMRRLDRQRDAHQKSGYNNQSHIFKPRLAARVRERPPRCLPEKWEDTYRLLRPCGSECLVGLAERGQRRVEEPPFWAGSIRARFLCRSRVVLTYVGWDAKAIVGRSIWLSE
jgi:hypothetical protein